MIVLDSSVLVGFFLASDAHHAQSLAWYNLWALRSTLIHVPTLCIVELAGTLGRQGVEHAIIQRSIAEMTTRNLYQLHELDLHMAQFSSTIAAAAGLRGADAVFVALDAQLGLPLVSWDAQQRARGARFCRTMTPVEAMEMAK